MQIATIFSSATNIHTQSLHLHAVKHHGSAYTCTMSFKRHRKINLDLQTQMASMAEP